VTARRTIGRLLRRRQRRREAGRLDREVADTVEHVAGPASLDQAPDEPVVLCLVRDGAPWLDAFLDHYRSLGCRSFVFLDNGSADDTIDRLRAEDGVVVLRRAGAYARLKNAMKRHLVQRWGRGRWCLLVDVDELLDHPDRDAVPLRRFLEYLDRHGYTAVLGHMLDMFPDGPLKAPAYGDFRAVHRCYDLSGIEETRYAPGRCRLPRGGHPFLRGGIRRLAFGLEGPLLSKHPIVRGCRRLRVATPDDHRVRHARIADVSVALYHYKWVGPFRERAEHAVREEQYWRESVEYRGYATAFRNPSFSLVRATTRQCPSANGLVEAGFLRVSDRWRRFVNRTSLDARRGSQESGALRTPS
jgi:hypothetical protein